MNKHKSSTLPDENNIEELLKKIQPIPSEQFHKKMMQASWRVTQEHPGKRTQKSLRVKTSLGMIALVIIAALIATPQGHVWAEKLFFILQLTPYSPTRTPVPSFTPTPYATNDIQGVIRRVNQQAGFVMLQPAILPYGYSFWGAEYFPDKKKTCQWYGYGPQPDPSTNGKRGFNGDIFLCQGRHIPVFAPDPVGTPGPLVIVEDVKIGSIIGQYTAIENFREYLSWEQDGFYMYIVVYGTMENTLDRVYLTKEEMAAMAASINTAELPHLTATPGTISTANPDIAMNFDSMEEAESYAGFILLKPSVLPKNFVFTGATVFGEQGVHHVLLDYAYGNAQVNIAGITIEEAPLGTSSFMNFKQVYPLDAITDIMVGKWPGVYVAGEYKQDGMIIPGPTPIPVWLADSPARDLSWQTDELQIRVYYWANTFYEGRLEKIEMLSIAEGMK